jgi:O-antigen/teichoic acid export membrane protein
MMLAGMMLLGLPFITFTLICLLAWAAAFVRALHMLRSRRKMPLLASSPAAVLAHVRANSHNLWHSGSLTVAEFVLYNFPYVAIPLLFADKTLIVAFDIFYKVVRFGAVSYAVPAESFLPAQTRAFYGGEWEGVMQYYRRTLLLGTVPLAACAIVLLGFGDRIFTTLLSRGGIVDHAQRVSMVLLLAAMLFQSAAGTFLVATGNYARLSRLAAVTLGLMAAAVIATWALELPFDTFLYLYAIMYCVHAAFYSGYLFRFLGSIAKGAARRPA